jgi:hypothetical protein
LRIPSTVTQIDERAFALNTLTSVTFVGNAPTPGGSVFVSNVGLTSVTVQYGTTGWSTSWSDKPVHVVGQPTATPTSPAFVSGAKITGTAKVGKSLTAKPGTWTGSATIRYTDQWYTCTKVIKSSAKITKVPSTCKVIAKATSASFKLTTKQKKTYVAVLVTATNGAGKTKVLSATTALVK